MGIYATFIFDFFIFNAPRATIIAPIALKPPPSPISLFNSVESENTARMIGEGGGLSAIGAIIVVLGALKIKKSKIKVA